MQFIIGIIVVIIIVAVLKELISQYWPWILLIVGIVLSFVFGGPVLGISIILLIVFIRFIIKCIKESNEKKLNTYLRKKCIERGFVPIKNINDLAPDFVKKTYKTSYSSIVTTFLSENEKNNVLSNTELVEPAVQYIKENVMADMQELMGLNYPVLRYSHSTPDEKLIADAMNKKCASQSEKANFSRIKLQEDTVREELKKKDMVYSEAFLNAYKFNGAIESSHFESVELSLDDL